MTLHAASAQADGSDCRFGPVLVNIPATLGPSAVVDSELRLLVYRVAGDADRDTSAAVTVLGIEWERDAEGHNRLKQSGTRSVIVDDADAGPAGEGGAAAAGPLATASLPADSAAADAAALALARVRLGSAGGQVAVAAGRDLLAAVPSWRVAGGRVLQLGEQVHWRLALPTADRLRLGASAERSRVPPELAGHEQAIQQGLSGLPLAPPESTCWRLIEDVAWLSQARTAQGVSTRLHSNGEHCFVMLGRSDSEAVPLGTETAPDEAVAGREDPDRAWLSLSVSVFGMPPARSGQGRVLDAPAPIASLADFGRVRADWKDWSVGRSGPCQGWLLLKTRSSAAGGSNYLAAPWSSAALEQLGQQILTLQPLPQAGAGQGTDGCVLPQRQP